MDKYRVLRRFKDKETKEMYRPGQEIDLTEERASEVVKNLERHGGGFLERIEVEVIEYENMTQEELEKINNDNLKSRLDELDIEYDSKATKNDLIALLIGDEEKKVTEEGE